MPGRIKKKKEKKKEFRASFIRFRTKMEDKRWKRKGEQNENQKMRKVRQREREETSAGERWNGEENSDLAKNNQPKYQQLFYI